MKAIVAAMVVLVACAPGEGRPLDVAQLGDLVPRRLIAPREDEAPRATFVPLQHTQAVPSDAVLHERPRPHRAKSREYWFAADASELSTGVELPTTAEGAIVRLQPLDLETRAAAGIDPTSLVLVDATGSEHGAIESMAVLASADELRDADVGLAPGTTAFALAPALGHGAFVLRTDVAPMAPRYLVHVHEKRSEVALAVKADRDAVLWGDTVTIDVALDEDVAELVSAQGSVRGPFGAEHELKLAKHGDALRGTFVIDDDRPPQGALWTIEIDARVRTDDGLLARRSGRTAIGYAVPSAGFVGELHIEEGSRGGLDITLPLEIAARGRYGVGAVLWGKDARGVARPVALAQSAAWLEAGSDALVLTFDEAALAQSAASPPYELRDLRLVDQGRLAVLHRQAFAGSLD
ncbi:MAG TPA: DUF4785 domain-containing protein [Nannocystaceae bacterium]|nr:DUF4785 domain-containing protein [Nannocystaceae bacterium]